MNTHRLKHLITLGTSSLLLFCASPVMGNNTKKSKGYVKLTSEQIALNNQAIEAQKAGELAKAQHFIESMILLGETDVSWMQLGRLYEMQGKCLMAQEAYSHVENAPPTKDVSHTEVLKKLLEYQKLHQEVCSATLVLDCKSTNMTITIDEDKSMPCSSTPLQITPGDHTIHANTSYGTNVLNVQLLANQTHISAIEVVNYENIAYQSGALHDDATLKLLQHTSRNYKIAGWTLLGSGLILAATGGALYGISYQKLEDKHSDLKNGSPDYTDDDYRNDYDNEKTKWKTGAALIGIGSASIVTGAVLLIVDVFKHKDLNHNYTSHTWEFQPYFGTDESGFTLTYQF